MKELLSMLLFGTLMLLSAGCKQKGLQVEDSAFDITGRWEAVYTVRVGSNDTTRHVAGDPNSCAYAVLDHEYNSGFELNADFSGDLWWCGGKKDQLFEYSLVGDELVIKYQDRSYLNTIDWIDGDAFLLRNDNGSYRMERVV